MSSAWNLGLPPMQPWRFTCFIGEIILDSCALGLAVFVIYKIICKINLHWNLKFLCINMFILICITMASRIPLAINNLCEFLNEPSEKTVWFIHDFCICASAFIQVAIAVERISATICAEHYEKVNHKFWCCFGVIAAWSAQLIFVFCIKLGWMNLIEDVIIFVVMDIIVIIIYASILRKNYIQHITSFISKPLSEQYQILENLRFIRPLIILIILQLLHNCLINSLMLIMIFYIVPIQNEEMHAILDVVFNISTAIFFCCFSIPFLIYKTTNGCWSPLDRRQSFLYRNNRIYSITSVDHGEIYFQQLVSVWM